MSTILSGRQRKRRPPALYVGSPWRTLGWFGFALAVIGIGQLVLYFYPAMAFGSAEWEFGATAQVLNALPLPTLGLAALFAAATGSGSRAGLIAMIVALMLSVVFVLAVLGLFWLVVPIALRATPANMREPIHQAIGRSTLSGVGFTVLYLWAAWLAVRQLKRSS